MPDNEEIEKVSEAVAIIQSTLTEFKEQYELDMRGDKKLSNGERGIVNEIRAIKKYHTEYPSFIWLIKHKTMPTILTTFGIGLFIYFIGMIIFLVFGPTAVVEAFLQLLGFPTL